ncbi:MAG: hypothetical protein BZ136_00375 [Methanosphaera sp. rholeuAM74]|nr:MAG: hypothetical protein BZ136_00375 [Methanosphaera sp. rholeuAM74]
MNKDVNNMNYKTILIIVLVVLISLVALSNALHVYEESNITLEHHHDGENEEHNHTENEVHEHTKSEEHAHHDHEHDGG